MTFTFWTTVVTLAALLPLQAQTPAPAPPPASGPTMDQTIDFINGTFLKLGSLAWEYDNLRGVTEVSDQRFAVSDSCLLTYTGRLQYSIDMESLKRGSGPEFTSRIRLDGADPRSIQIVEERSHDAESTPLTFDVEVKQAATHEDRDQKFDSKPTLGYFDTKETAEHFAKALIHAMVLCHKPEAPPLF